MSTPNPIPKCKFNANIWTHENRVSSDSQIKEICLPGLPEGAKELIGKLVRVDGKTKLNGIFKYAPFRQGSKMTTDGFDQTVLYNNLHAVPTYLMKLGFINLPEVIWSRRGKNYKITGHANGTDALNAWYSPQTGEMTFGTNKGKWHLASDSDISAHEEGHFILDHYHPGLSGWFSKEGGAIHEGFADTIAAGYYNDSEISEDFPPNQGRPESKTDGLRNVDNNLTLDDVSTEVHDRGKVYGGFFWSIKKSLQDPNGQFKLTSREAADIMLKLTVNHGANYKTTRPEPKDFVEAVIAGMNDLAKAKKLGVDPSKLKKVILEEAMKRKLIKMGDKPSKAQQKFKSIKDVENYLSKNGCVSKFKKTHNTTFIGGTFEIYQQQLISKKYGPLNIIGGGIYIKRNSNGNIVFLSTRDVYQFNTNQIDESGTISPKEATKLAFEHLKIETLKTKSQIYYYSTIPKTKMLLKKTTAVQMEYQIAKSDYLYFKNNKPQTKIIMMENGKTPHYEIKTGMSIYYINTKDGNVIKYKDVLD